MNGLSHTATRAWYKLGKQRGILGMVWGMKVKHVAYGLAVLACLALASGANWTDAVSWFSW